MHPLAQGHRDANAFLAEYGKYGIRNPMRSLPKRLSLLIVSALLVGLIAVLAATNLWYLRKLQSRNVHASATQSVMELGSELARNLASQPVVLSTKDDPRRWADFARMIRSVKRVEPSLHYVSVTEGDVTLFHEDISTVDGKAAPGADGRDVRVGRKLLATEQGVVPVLTFSAITPEGAGPGRIVQVALRKDAVQQREEQAGRLLGIMFRLSVITLVIALGLAAILGVWGFLHEMDRQRRRRDEEHLAFAGLLADGIIHDVRNPMSSLRLDIQMLQKEGEKAQECRPARIAELAERARKTMDRIDLVMREFLYVSKPESGVPERFELNVCVRDCLDLLGPRFERAGITVDVRLATEPLDMMGQSVGLKRAIINVLTNAKQASPQGGTVIVSSRRESGSAVVLIEDEGPGIKAAEVNRIFEMFVSGRPDGIGLGLYLAKAAIENCGGKIRAENRAEGGARFIIRLPLDG